VETIEDQADASFFYQRHVMVALDGGGSVRPQPGEVTRAHRGVSRCT
jgi:hypothetical protein